MRKKLVVLIIVVLIALVAVVPALAAGNGNRNRGSGHGHGGPGGRDQQDFTIGGEITDIDIGDDGNGTITVENDSRIVTVQVTNSTSFFMCTSDSPEPITFEDVVKGDWINIKGTVDGDVFTADRVTVRITT